MQTIPLKPLPNQTLQVQLSNQACSIQVYQLAFGVFFDLYVSGQLVIAGVICQNLNRIVRDRYFGFSGDFVFYDVGGGTQDPIYTGLGARFQLLYLDEADLELLGFGD